MDWFKNWFNSKYYHILYRNRDEQEAVFFLNKIINHIKLKKGKVLDVACGKGRHAKYLNKIGFNVVGIDLSKNSIDLANKHENEKLKFYVHDMRNVFKENEYNLVTNLFTSFGYFERKENNDEYLSATQGPSNNICPASKKGEKSIGIISAPSVCSFTNIFSYNSSPSLFPKKSL